MLTLHEATIGARMERAGRAFAHDACVAAGRTPSRRAGGTAILWLGPRSWLVIAEHRRRDRRCRVRRVGRAASRGRCAASKLRP